jgi:hypothetical protein
MAHHNYSWKPVARLLWVAGCAIIVAGCRDTAGNRVSLLQPGDSLPSLLHDVVDDAADAELIWLVRTEDMYTCQTYDYEFRRVTADFGDRVRIVVLHVGTESDTEILRRFLTDRRLSGEVLTIPPALFERRYRREVFPSAHLVVDRTIVWSSSNLSTERVRLTSVIARHLNDDSEMIRRIDREDEPASSPTGRDAISVSFERGQTSTYPKETST